jgi:lysyl-tRNA synthetase class 2
MVNVALSLGNSARDVVAFVFGVGGALILDEFALSIHLDDVYWSEEGRRSIDACIMWMLLGLLLHDQTVVPRTIGVVVVAINIVLSVVTCLKGKLTLGLVSVFVPPVGVLTAVRLARPGSIWAQLSYRSSSAKLAKAHVRFDPRNSRLERIRIRVLDLVAGAPNPSVSPE